MDLAKQDHGEGQKRPKTIRLKKGPPNLGTEDESDEWTHTEFHYRSEGEEWDLRGSPEEEKVQNAYIRQLGIWRRLQKK